MLSSGLLLLSPFFWMGLFFYWLRTALWVDHSLGSGSSVLMRLGLRMGRILGSSRRYRTRLVLLTGEPHSSERLCMRCILRFLRRLSDPRARWKKREAPSNCDFNPSRSSHILKKKTTPLRISLCLQQQRGGLTTFYLARKWTADGEGPLPNMPDS
jgi:hypothetical protein